jgi:hypothetical protein
MEGVRPELIMELEKDINRLIKTPIVFQNRVRSRTGHGRHYPRDHINRIIPAQPNVAKIKFNLKFDRSHPCRVPHNPILMSWVFENLCKTRRCYRR